MKLIVDMPEGIYKCALKDNMFVSKPLSDAIKYGIPIPEGSTNGDMIKALFPEGIPKNVIWTLQNDKGVDWWNAPYKRGEMDE